MNALAAAVPAVTTLALLVGLAGGAPGRVVAPAPPADGHDVASVTGRVQAHPAVGAPGAVRAAGEAFPTQAGAQAAPRGRWQWPMQPRPLVVRRFEAPASSWGRGHRGIDLAGVNGQPVSAVAAGIVSHVGVVAGRPTLSVLHPDGLRSTYEPVAASVGAGDRVEAGTTLGTLAPVGSHCLPQTCLHLGALRARAYLDPLTLLSAPRVRLLPLWR